MGQIEGFVRLGLAPSICPECRQEVIGRATGVEKLLRWEKALQSSSVQLVCFVFNNNNIPTFTTGAWSWLRLERRCAWGSLAPDFNSGTFAEILWLIIKSTPLSSK